MTREEILAKLQTIFRNVLENDAIILNEETTANDVEEWTSLTHVHLINTIESTMNIKFSVREMMGWQNVGEIMDSIEHKI